MLYSYGNYFDSKGSTTLKSSEYTADSNGNVTMQGKRLIFNKTTDSEGDTDYTISFKNKAGSRTAPLLY